MILSDLDPDLAAGIPQVQFLEMIQTLSLYFGECTAWGQFERLYDLLGPECVHTRISARLVLDDPVLRRHLDGLVSQWTRCQIPTLT